MRPSSNPNPIHVIHIIPEPISSRPIPSRPTQNIPRIITQPCILKQQPKNVNLHVLFPQNPLRPSLPFHSNLLRNSIVARKTDFLIPDEEFHDTIDVGESVVHWHEVFPRNEARVVPFIVDGRFDGQRSRAEETTVATAEAVTVDVGQIFVLILLAHFHALFDFEVVVGVPTMRAAIGKALQIHRGRVAPRVDPNCERAVM
jgi:hypothetical protein